LPVRLEHRNVFQREKHFGVLLKRFSSHKVGVLRRDGKHNATLPQIQREALNGPVGLTERIPLRNLYALQAIVSDHSTPERIVEVHHENLLALAADSRHAARNVISVQRDQFVREREFTQVP